jgi:Flp pilus assembly protein TadG
MRQHLGARKGNYMMTMPFFIPILVGFAALSVDIAYINMTQTQVQHVADAASHAAYVTFRSTNDTSVGDAAAQYILDQNLVGNQKAKLAQPITYGEWDPDTFSFDATSPSINAARAVVARNTINSNAVDLFFAPILGYNTADVAALGITAGRTREIMIIQDVSCSFGGQDILNSRDADVAFLDYLNNYPNPGDKLGMTMFGGRAWYPKMYELSEVAVHYAPMRTQFLRLNICSSLPSDLAGTPTSHCNTTQARGIILARDQFTAYGDKSEYQAAIVISDGEPTAGLTSSTNGSTDSIRAADQLWGRDDANNDATSWNYQAYGCGDANTPGGSGAYAGVPSPKPSGWVNPCKNRTYNTTFHGGVHMWSVFFGPNDAGLRGWMEDNMVNGDGSAYATTNSNELAQIMTEIASSIPVVLTD